MAQQTIDATLFQTLSLLKHIITQPLYSPFNPLATVNVYSPLSNYLFWGPCMFLHWYNGKTKWS